MLLAVLWILIRFELHHFGRTGIFFHPDPRHNIIFPFLKWKTSIQNFSKVKLQYRCCKNDPDGIVNWNVFIALFMYWSKLNKSWWHFPVLGIRSSSTAGWCMRRLRSSRSGWPRSSLRPRYPPSWPAAVSRTSGERGRGYKEWYREFPEAKISTKLTSSSQQDLRWAGRGASLDQGKDIHQARQH